jgi:hypothetical protein
MSFAESLAQSGPAAKWPVVKMPWCSKYFEDYICNTYLGLGEKENFVID